MLAVLTKLSAAGCRPERITGRWPQLVKTT